MDSQSDGIIGMWWEPRGRPSGGSRSLCVPLRGLSCSFPFLSPLAFQLSGSEQPPPPLLSLPHTLPHQGSIAMEPAGHRLNTLKQSLINLSCLKLFPEVFHHSSGKRPTGRMCEEYTRTHMHCQHCVVELA